MDYKTLITIIIGILILVAIICEAIVSAKSEKVKILQKEKEILELELRKQSANTKS